MFLYLGLPLAILVAVSAGYGIFESGAYAVETESWKIQAIGQDITDLFVVVPTLVTSAWLAHKNKKTGIFIFSGTSIFIAYSYAIYCFAVHFNGLFLVYCFTLGLSLYAFVRVAALNTFETIVFWFDDKFPSKFLSVILTAVAFFFYFAWLSDIIPALLHHRVPASLAGTGMLTNPIHVLDLAFVLPGFLLLSCALWNGKPTGHFFAPTAFVFCTLMALNIIALALLTNFKQLSNTLSLAGVTAVFACVSLLILIIIFKHLNKGEVERGIL